MIDRLLACHASALDSLISVSGVLFPNLSIESQFVINEL